MLAELNWIRADNINPDPSVDYRKNFVLSTFSPDYLNVWWMNIILLAMVAMFWPALLLLFKKADPAWQLQLANRRPLKALAGLLLFTLFMATPLSQPVWKLVHPLQQTQFPWRWLAITSIVCSLVLAMAVPLWTRFAKGPKRPLFVIALGTIVMSFAFSMFHIVREATWLSPAEFEQTLSEIPGSAGVTQWLPVWVHEPLPTMTARVDAPNRVSSIKTRQPQQRVFHVEAGQATEARVQTFFYPHWKATAAGRNLDTHPDQNGSLMVTLPSEAVDVNLEFREPNRSLCGRLIAAWLGIDRWAFVQTKEAPLIALTSGLPSLRYSMKEWLKRFGPGLCRGGGRRRCRVAGDHSGCA